MSRRWTVWWVVLLLLLAGGCQSKGGEPAGELEQARIEQDTHYLCETFPERVTGTPGERAACDWLEEQLKAAGFDYGENTLVRQPFLGLEGRTSENLMAVCNRGGWPVLCVTAHYDNVAGSPGARDNGAAVAILLELARRLGPEAQDLSAEVRLILLGSEENGYHGSRAYVESLTPEEREDHLAIFNMDISAATEGEGQMVCFTLGGRREAGYQQGDFFDPAENRASQAAAQAAARLWKETLTVAHGGESDQVTFDQWEMDAVNLCWRRVEDGFPMLPPEYHQPEDRADSIDYETAWATGRCVLEALRILGEKS